MLALRETHIELRAHHPQAFENANQAADISFSASWQTLLRELEDLPDRATLITPLSHDRFTISNVQEQRVVVQFLDKDIDPNQPLQREQFETMYRRITDARGGFGLDRLPPDADAYPAVWSVHPRSRSLTTRCRQSEAS